MTHKATEILESKAHHALTMVFVEFLRAIAADDIQGRVFKLESQLYAAWISLGEVEPERQAEVCNQAITQILDDARDNPDGDLENMIAKKSAKVLAEKISGTLVQLSRAESAMFHLLLRWHLEREQALKANRWPE